MSLVLVVMKFQLYFHLMMVIFLLFAYTKFANGQDLQVTSLPFVLFQSNGGIHNVVEGSVIQLYCSVESTTASFSWTKEGSPVVIDVPHLRERISNDSSTTTSVLTMDNFQSSDTGTYQCSARDGMKTGNGAYVTLNGTFIDNQTGIQSDITFDSILLLCQARHMGASTSTPTVSWIVNGRVVLTSNCTNCFTTFLNISNFTASDAGVYQCIFTDTDATGEVVTSKPMRLDTDIFVEHFGIQVSTLYFENISPEVIFLRPPEELVIEVRCRGRYSGISWSRIGASVDRSLLSNYDEVYALGRTTEADYGLYQIVLTPSPPSFQVIVPNNNILEFLVTPPVNASTRANHAFILSVLEGGSLRLSCTSSGAPTPTIVWEMNGQPVQFNTTETITQPQVQFVGAPGGGLTPDVTLGNITSEVLIINAQNPSENGTYTCIGSNDDFETNSSALILVHVHVPSVLQVISLPSVLFQSNGGIHNVVEGSVIQLYCSVESTTASFSWTKDGSPVVIDVPHLRERTSNDSTTTTSVLTVDNFHSTDTGTYQCSASDGMRTGNGANVTLNAYSSNGDGDLSIIDEPANYERMFESLNPFNPGTFIDNRTGIQNGMTAGNNLLLCKVRYMGISTSTPNVSWTVNGRVVSTSNCTNCFTSSLNISSFAASDAGVYQCIFTDTDATGEVVTSKPMRLDTDIFVEQNGMEVSTLYLEKISPTVIFLHPPEKLVIEVRCRGRYSGITWSTTGASVDRSLFSNHDEIYALGSTTEADYGFYQVILTPSPPSFQILFPDSILEFLVIAPVNASTRANHGLMLSVLEGGSLRLSCTSIGAPTPTIVWEMNGQPAQFNTTEVITQPQPQFVGAPGGGLVPDIARGNITSEILIINAQNPSDNGAYTCIGSNDDFETNSSALILVQILSVPASVMLSSSILNLIPPFGLDVTLICAVELSQALELPVIVNTTLTTPAGFMIHKTAQPVMGSLINYTTEFLISTFRRNESGLYTCGATVSLPSYYMNESNSITHSVRVTTGVYLALRGVHITNYSNIDIRHIGKSSDSPNDALQCVTDIILCCMSQNHTHGEWYQPNGTLVQGTTSTISFYTTRGYNGNVSLNRPSDVESPTGLFCCEVPDSTNTSQILCVNIVGIFISIPSDPPVAGENYTLECSVDGSEGTFQWLGPPDCRTPVIENSPRVNILSNTISSQLQFRPIQQSDNGSYSCSAATNGGLALSTELVDTSVNAPTVSVHIGSIIVSTPTAVGNYLLSCSVSGAENLYPTITYRWIKNSSTRSLQVGTNSSTLFFTSLRLTDTAGYICEVTISSNYLLGDIIAVNANPHYVRIQGESDSDNAGTADTAMCSCSCASEVGIAVGAVIVVVCLVIIVITIIVILCLWSYIRRKLSNSAGDMNNFAVSANMAYGEVNLMAEAEYENPDAILRPSGQKSEAITNIMYEAIDSNPAAQTEEAVCVTHDST